MKEQKKGFTFEEYVEVIKEFSPCMDDYPYFYDIKNDIYYISEKALERFALPSNQFTDVTETHRKFVHEEDIEELVTDLGKMVSGEKDSHNIEYRWIGKDGEPIWINCRGRVIKDENNRPKYMLGCVNEIGLKQKADNVSGLRSIQSVANVLETFCTVASAGYTLHIGIDDFKAINERFGHEYGNFILRGVSQCITDSLLPGQEVYSVVADEFIVVDYFSDVSHEGKELYNTIREKVDKFIEKNRYETVFTISGGILSCSDLGGIEYQEYIKLSQFALSQAKLRGKNQVYFFDINDYDAFIRKSFILSAIREAVGCDFEGFDVYFQPIIDENNTSAPYAAEALLRYTLPHGDIVSPIEFVPALEESGLIIPVGKYVLGRAMAFCKKAREVLPEFKVNVNVSFVQILKSPFVGDFCRMLSEYDLTPDSITVELTESGHLGDSVAIQKVWDSLRDYGVSIALDDFGTGYSNLINIGAMAPNVLKLDRSFTVKAIKNDFERDLMANIIYLVHSLGIKICVEGVETQEELEKIRALNPDYIQGYYYGRPCPEGEFVEKFNL